MKKDIILAPSVLAADFSDIKGALEEIKNSTCKWVHLDVMDGSFVPNITFGPKFIKDIRKHSDLFFDAHLMINNPQNHIESFANAGCDCITIHAEACQDVYAVLKLIKSYKVKCGICIRPITDVSVIEEYLDYVDLVLIMSVEPGFGGQSFKPEMMEKVKRLYEIRGNRKYLISVDGGINLETIKIAKDAGIDVAVAGSAFFKAQDKQTFTKEIQS